MRSKVAITLTFLLLSGAAGARGDVLLWDNYPGDVLEDATINITSERETQIHEATWTVDDVDILQSPLAGVDPSLIMLTRLEWVGARQPGFTYDRADVIVLDSSLNDLTAMEYSDLSLTSLTLLDPDPNPDPQVETYRGEITFSEPIPVPGEHFYIGVRLVGESYRGRNFFVTSSVDTDIFGRTEGHTKSVVFGAPDWTPSSYVWFGVPSPDDNFEFAFRTWAIPEPASAALLLIGGLALAVWRR
jgi:hypothetical protein